MLCREIFAAVFLSASLLSVSAPAADDYVITLKDHQFTPKTLAVPAGQKIVLTVKNEQATPAEFESAQLDREKVVGANSQIIVNLGPLDAGDYSYFDDFHQETTGIITAK
jgi:hypothetical protein